jgi:hypothetical protein
MLVQIFSKSLTSWRNFLGKIWHANCSSDRTTQFLEKKQTKMQHNYSYRSVLAASERIGWRVEDLIGGDKKLDFTKPFLPESLAQG